MHGSEDIGNELQILSVRALNPSSPTAGIYNPHQLIVASWPHKILSCGMGLAVQSAERMSETMIKWPSWPL